MKNKLLLILGLTMSIFVQAQNKTKTIKLALKETLTETIDLGDNGFLLATAKTSAISPNQPSYTNLDKKIRYFTPTLDLNWEIDLPIPEAVKGSRTQYLVSTKDAKTIYQMYYKGTQSLLYITLIKNGKVVVTKPPSGKITIKYIQNIFCDHDNLYILTTKNGKQNDLSKVDEKLILHTFSGSDFTYSYTEIDLPKIVNPRTTTFWHYIGHKDNAIYLSSKTESDSKYIYKLTSVDNKGKIINTTEIEFPIDNKYLAPALNIKNFSGTICFAKRYIGAFATNIETYGNLYLSDDCKSFFIYGLYSKVKKNRKSVSGFILKKYNIDGTKLFDINSSLPTKLKSDNGFTSPRYTNERIIDFKMKSDTLCTLQLISYSPVICTLNYGKDGNLLNKNYLDLSGIMHVLDASIVYGPNIKHKILDIKNSLAPAKGDASVKYLRSLPKQKREKQTRLYYFPFSKNEVLISFNPAYSGDSRKISIMSFKK